ncbi:hypothetical protein H696_05749 [Fonticula alba]|uniref:Uncharacterized protein n=1 Tax=Fonticula alba TaxID=691883 RepID=A0A058Z2Q3_FONAL|nr:hypothetical protein H696_05749 [Fonticula alba]KCV67807.1 hypothetical protein H696_05749 [Fonticula alba]|eukprot:XP_009497838.1 hypothetical protein H696_05749 [Fonticula alba]
MRSPCSSQRRAAWDIRPERCTRGRTRRTSCAFRALGRMAEKRLDGPPMGSPASLVVDLACVPRSKSGRRAASTWWTTGIGRPSALTTSSRGRVPAIRRMLGTVRTTWGNASGRVIPMVRRRRPRSRRRGVAEPLSTAPSALLGVTSHWRRVWSEGGHQGSSGVRTSSKAREKSCKSRGL